MNSYQLFEAMCVAMVGNDDQWRRDIEDEIDATPETLDFCTPECVGRLDAEEGLTCDSFRHGYLKLLDIEAYIIGWKAAVALEEQVEGRLDAEYHYKGQW